MTKDLFYPYAHQSINADDLQAVQEALTQSIITRGPCVEAFERAVAEYCGAIYAVAFNSGTTALYAACHAAQVGPSDRILTTPNTFVASVFAGIRLSATPVFVDIDRSSGNMNLEQTSLNLKAFESSRGRMVVMPVHFAGIPFDMEQLDHLVDAPETIVIEDAAHALGSSYPNGQKIGCCAWSDMTVLSFHPAKTITTGEGGMVLTNDADLYHRLRRFRNNGIERDPELLEQDSINRFDGYYEVVELTGNFNFTEFQAALGLSQLKRIDQFIAKRSELMAAYRCLLETMPDLKMLNPHFDKIAAYHLCVVQIDFAAYGTTRDFVMSKLKEKGIGTQVHYIPVYRHPFFTHRYGDISEYFPEMESYYAQTLSLPLYADLTLDDVAYIANVLKDILAEERQKVRLQAKVNKGTKGRN